MKPAVNVQPKFTPSEAEKSYYSLKTPAVHLESILHTLFIDPWSRPADPTYGRDSIPFSPKETALRTNPAYNFWDARVFLDEQKTSWIYYQVVEASNPHVRKNADMIFVHGMNDYGGSCCEHVTRFLEAGYRVMAMDLPGHGRSTGLHGYISDLEDVLIGIHAAIQDLVSKDRDHEGKRKEETLLCRRRFIVGASLGGFLALTYALRYLAQGPDRIKTSEKVPTALDGTARSEIHGMMLLCPMIDLSPEIRPPKASQFVAKKLSAVLGRWPMRLGPGDRPGEWDMDPQTYDNRIRLGTGLACLAGLEAIKTRLFEVKLPFKVLHGTSDDITWYKGSQRLFEEARSTDKEIKLYPGENHILLKVGRDDAEDAKRQAVIDDMLDWLDRR